MGKSEQQLTHKQGGSGMSKLVRGADLNGAQRLHILNAFIYRWTHENAMRTRVYRCNLCDIRKPYVNTKSANGHTHPTIPLQTDTEWLAEHAFYINKDGSVSARHRHAEPYYLADNNK